MLSEFARNVGCLGNFTLVPSGFNRFRSRLGDYFDLSLKELKLKDSNWLGEKVNFSQYVNIFFLWDYTKVENDHNTFKPFFNGHSEENIFPKGDEIIECVSTMNKNILERGKFMVDMLHIAEENKEKYEKIQENLSKKDTLFESITDASNKILKEKYK